MKEFVLALTFLAIVLAPLAARAQPPSSEVRPSARHDGPPPQTPTDKELALTKLKLAIANAQLANASAASAKDNADAKVKDAQALMDSTRSQLGLDSSYVWDFQAGDFVKRPAAPAAK